MAKPAPALADKRLALITDGLAGPGQVRMYLARVSQDRAEQVLRTLFADTPEIIETTEPAGDSDSDIKGLHDALTRCLGWLGAAPQGPLLTPREVECLEACAAGKTYWETGKILGISERTVIFHMQSVREKLTASTNAQAVAKAVRAGLV